MNIRTKTAWLETYEGAGPYFRPSIIYKGPFLALSNNNDDMMWPASHVSVNRHMLSFHYNDKSIFQNLNFIKYVLLTIYNIITINKQLYFTNEIKNSNSNLKYFCFERKEES